jgi:hypothetical protein
MYRQMPLYSSDQDNYLKQMYEWHTRMAQYEEQVRSFHLERATQFRKMVEDRPRVAAGNGTV